MTSASADDPRARLLSRVRRSCEQASPWLGPLRHELSSWSQELEGPIRLAVVGRVKAGKSTLVNALLGRRVAPTRAGECTRVVTWYRFGSPDRAQLLLRDGTRRDLPLAGALPEDLPVDPSSVDRLDVWLQSAPLREYTLIDTPGLASMTAERVAATERVLLGDDPSARVSVTEADAVLFLVRDAVRAVDLEFLERLADGGSIVGAPRNVLGVLSHADLFAGAPWDEADPIELATRQAATLADRHRPQFATIVALSGLLAEAVRTGLVTGASARALAAVRDTPTAQLRLWRRLGPPAEVSGDDLERIERHLGPYGLSRGRAVAPGGIDALQAWLAERSGIAPLEALIARRFLARGDVLKARRVLHSLRRMTRLGRLSPEAVTKLRDLLEETATDPALHRLREADALDRLDAGGLGGDLADELTALLVGSDPAARLGMPPGASHRQLLEVARSRETTAQARVSLEHVPVAADAARVLSRSYRLLTSELS